VVQQIASSAGVATISVVLTNQLNGSDAVSAAGALQAAKATGQQPPAFATELVQKLGDAFQPTVLSDMSHAFQVSYWVALAILVVTLVPVALLPRRKEQGLTAPAPATLMH
jgi:hypothetical protein